MLSGPAGTGKSFVIKTFIEHAKMLGKNLQTCALTGCAAILLNCGAKTIHSWSGIKVHRGKTDEVVGKVLRSKHNVSTWKKTNILIVDEVSMLSKKMFEILNRIGKIARNRPGSAFGGIQVVFTGDFFQLPPVGNQDDPDTCRFCFESPDWFSVFPLENHIELKTIFRQTDPIYINILSQIRVGEISPENIEILQKYIRRPSTEETVIPPKLFPLRKRTEYINNEMFEKINEPIYEFYVDVNTNNKLYLDTLKPIPSSVLEECNKHYRHGVDGSGEKEKERLLEFYMNILPCSHVVSLKRGASVMCIQNLDLPMGICNGSQGVVIDFLERGEDEDIVPVVKFSNGVVRPIHYQYWQMEDLPTWTIGQIPLMLSWAMTIHKMQGITISMAEIDVGNTVFEYGQIYVALSRLRSLDGLYLLNFNPKKIKANPVVLEFYEKFISFGTLCVQHKDVGLPSVLPQTTDTKHIFVLHGEEPEPETEKETTKIFTVKKI